MKDYPTDNFKRVWQYISIIQSKRLYGNIRSSGETKFETVKRKITRKLEDDVYAFILINLLNKRDIW